MRGALKFFALAPSLCWLGCSSQLPVGSKFVKSVPVAAAQGATITVSKSDDPLLAGTVLVIPAGALAADTTITITEGLPVTLAGSTPTAAGPVAQFGPSGTVFAKPVSITLPFTLGAGQTSSMLGVVGVEADDQTNLVFGNADLTITAATSTLSFAASGFTRFGAILGAPVCPASLRCCDGQCSPNDVCPDFCPTCPAGQSMCNGQCIINTLPCHASADAGSSCPPGETLCCDRCSAGQVCPDFCVADGGAPICPFGQNLCCDHCLPSGIDCPSVCPSVDGGLLCPSGEALCNGVCIIDTVPCYVDAGLVCPPGQVPCNGGCIVNTLVCISYADAGSVCPSGEVPCCGQCIAGQVCNEACAIDAGLVCPPGEVPCNGSCIVNTLVCIAYTDAGLVCPPGDVPCNGRCIVDTFGGCVQSDGGP